MSLVDKWRSAKPSDTLSDTTWIAFAASLVSAAIALLAAIFHAFSFAMVLLCFAMVFWFVVCFGAIQDLYGEVRQ